MQRNSEKGEAMTQPADERLERTLVERLRGESEVWIHRTDASRLVAGGEIMIEAADRIAQLEAETNKIVEFSKSLGFNGWTAEHFFQMVEQLRLAAITQRTRAESAEKEAKINMDNFKATNQAYVKMDERRLMAEEELAINATMLAKQCDLARQAESESDALRKELEAMRVLAANPHTIQKVKDELGPISLWSKDVLDREIQRRIVEATAALRLTVDAMKADALKLRTEFVEALNSAVALAARREP